jgi:hypothetical protein
MEDILRSERTEMKTDEEFVQTYGLEISELALFKKKPAQFRSIYYVLKKL